MQSFLAQKRLFTAVLGSEKVANPVFKAVENRLRTIQLHVETKSISFGQKIAFLFQEARQSYWRHQVLHLPLQSRKSITCIALPFNDRALSDKEIENFMTGFGANVSPASKLPTTWGALKKVNGLP